jgi:hypothetical protein
MRKCCVCGSFLVHRHEGLDHLAFKPYDRDQIVFICQGCLYSIQNHMEYCISYKYADI